MTAILADDLTSALDGAAPFTARGLSTRVVWHEAALSTEVDVVSIDLDSRFLSPREAEARFAQAARRVKHATVIYKTVDSTLRGNVGAETKGALMGSGRGRAVVAPAFPAGGRTTVNGHQFVGGIPLERTAFAHDPRTPVTTGRIVDHLRGIDPAWYTVHDAAQDRALDAIVSATGLDSDVIWVGSPGLGAALGRAVPAQSSTRVVAWQRAERVLVVVGSPHAANAPQVEQLRLTGAELVETKSPGDMVPPSRLADQVRQAFTKSAVVCLVSPRELMIGRPDDPARLAGQLAAVVAEAAAEFDGLVATGGDTARRIVDALRATAIDLVGEVEPGVPGGVLRTPARDVAFITKAGGFGQPDTLRRCVGRLLTPTQTFVI